MNSGSAAPIIALAAKKRRRRNEAEASATPRVLAGISERGGRVSIVVGRLAEDGSAGPRIRLSSAEVFSVSETDRIRAFLKDQGVALLIRVIPPGQGMSRVVQVPEGSGADRGGLLEAMLLSAETDLPVQLPWYRRTAGSIRPFAGGPEAGLLLGWPPRVGAEDSLASVADGLKQLWTAEVAALAAVMRTSECAGPGVWAAALDAATGSISVIAAGKEKVSVRSLRGENQDAAAWRDAVEQAVEDGAAAVGLEAPDRVASAHAIATSGSLLVVVGGERRDAAWVEKHALAAGALTAFADPDPPTRSLFNLHLVEPRERVNPVKQVIMFLNSPTRAAVVALVCLTLLLLAPLAVAKARHDALRARVSQVKDIESRLSEGRQATALYGAMKENRWPMTKLLADIAASTPVGIQLDSLEISKGDSVVLRGTAEKVDLVTKLRENLTNTKVFESVNTPNIGSSSGTSQFQMQAKVAANGVFYAAKPADDFATNPLGKRIYGPEWTWEDEEDGPPSGSSSSNHPGVHADDLRRRLDRSGGSARSTPAPRPSSTPSSPGASTGSAPKPAPAPLSDDAISKLKRSEAMMQWVTRQNAAKVKEYDQATRDRLAAEAVKCREQMERLKEGEK